MSEKMVTLQIPLSEAEKIAKLDPKGYGGPGGMPRAMQQCREAVRVNSQTNKEKWEERLELPWDFSGDAWNIRNTVLDSREVNLVNNTEDGRIIWEQAQLMGAAHDLFEACVQAHEYAGLVRGPDVRLHSLYRTLGEAIAKAAGAKVLDEIEVSLLDKSSKL